MFPLDRSMMTAINKRISVARRIDESEHQVKKAETEKNWFTKAALEADIDLDEDMYSILFIVLNPQGHRLETTQKLRWNPKRKFNLSRMN